MSEKSSKYFLFTAILLIMTAVIQAGAIPVKNHSFEYPYIGPVYPYAYPDAEDWIELDNDIYNRETGVFYNITGIANTDANQLAFLSGEQGTVFMQDLDALYQEGKAYRLTVSVCVAGRTPPDPNGLKLSLYYTSSSDPNRVDVAVTHTKSPSLFDPNILVDCSVYLPTVEPAAAYVGKNIGIAIRANGALGYGEGGAYGTYWDIDNVRVTEYPLIPNFTIDFFVNFEDFAIMAADWLSCDDPFTDVTGDGCVDKQDLLILAQYWLEDV